MLNDTFTGGEYYWIRFNNGTWEVRKEMPEPYDNETVFKGHYKDCVEYLDNLVKENVDYDLDL